MSFWKPKNKIEPKQNFYSKIKEYYFEVSNDRIPTELLNEIILKVTDRIYDDYRRFWKEYPKSRKRYSTLKLQDIENPFVHYLITDFLKEKEPTEYRNFSKILFKMDDVAFDNYEKQKYWYENK